MFRITKKMHVIFAAGALLLALQGLTHAKLHYISHNSTAWVADIASDNNYVALSATGSASTFAAGSTGLNYVFHNGATWVTDSSVNTKNYVALSATGSTSTFAAGSTGLNYVFHNGATWVTDSSVNTNNYVALSATGSTSTFAAGATGLNYVFHNGAWVTDSSFNTKSYTALSALSGVPGTIAYTFAAGSGGLDAIFHNGAAWVTDSINSNNYVDIVADKTTASSGATVYAAKAGGGLDKIYHNGTNWVAESISGNSYLRIATDGTANVVYGVRTGGGLEKIFYNGSAWVTELISNNSYVVITGDGQANKLFSVTAPALLAPVANEKVAWKHPDKYTIKWPSSGGNNYVNIKFFSGNSLDWQVIATYVPDTGSYLWTVPALESSNCMLWVCDSSSGATVAISTTPFEIYECLVNDITGNCFVNFADFAVLASQWLQCENAFDSDWCDQYRWFGPTFKEFSGTVQSDATPDVSNSTDDLWKNGALSWGRWDILWSNCEPNQGQWNQQYLINRVSEIWPEHMAVNAQVLPLLFAGTSWSGDGTVTISSSHIADWQNYVYKVVDYLRRPPYNVEYFQIWNEATAGTGDWWEGTMDQFMTNCYLPAAEVIHDLGCKVVYGGWPDTVSLATYVSLMDSHNAWAVTDVHDMHYKQLTDWQYLYDAMASRGYANRPIWQTEVGFTTDSSTVSMMYPRFLYWGLTHNWSYKDKYKLFWFAQWSPDDAGAFGYHKILYSGSSLWTHGKSVQTLSNILKSSQLTAYMNVQNNLGLSFAQDFSSSGIETFATDDAKVIVVHLNAIDYSGASTITLTLPAISKTVLTTVTRVDIAGYSTDLTSASYNNGSGQLTIPAPKADNPASPVNSWGLSGNIHTFYIKVK